jgi:cardiolipin synthase
MAALDIGLGMSTKSLLITACAAALGALATLLVLNFLPEARHIQRTVPHQFGTSDEQFQRAMSAFSNGSISTGNAVETLVNGDEIFPSMLDAIGAARTTINFETYIYWSGTVGYEFARALAAKSRQGVEVRVLIDWVGSLPFDEDLISVMTSAGVEFVRFRPVHWYTLDRVNNRDHRKLLIVDGRLGFTGGVGIADNWRGDARNVDEWRDTHYRISGPVVTAFQAAFAENWLEATGETLLGDKFYPPQAVAGDLETQLIISSQPSGSENMELMFLTAIASAQRRIRVGMAYFVPDEIALTQLLEARKRGIEIEVIVPNHLTDVPIVRKSSRHLWGELLRAGVRIYEYQPSMYHPKLLIVDDVWTSVGSTNFDERSLKLNDEASLNVHDRTFAATQGDVFERDLQRSIEITFEEWQGRSLTEKLTDWLTSTLRSQL